MNAVDCSAGIWGLFVSAFISATVMPGGSEAVLALLTLKSEFSPLWLLFIATAGNTLGAVTTWLLGWLAAVGWPVEKLTKGCSQKALYSLHRWGIPALLFSWLPLIGDALCFTAGWLRFPFLPSLIAIAAGKAVRYAIVIYIIRGGWIP